MVHYKLIYFDARGLAEVARQLFHLADVQYEDCRVGFDEFQKLKPTLPAGHVPILYVDGFEISQSATIWRYLARKFGLAGKTPEEEASADSIADLFRDYLFSFRQLSSATFFGKTEEEIQKIRAEVVIPATEIYYTALNKVLAKSKSGFLVGDSLTWADLIVADNLTSATNLKLFDGEKQKALKSFHEKILNYPKLKAYFENRKYTVV